MRIPKALVTEAPLAEGDRLSFDLPGDGSIVLRSRRRRYSLDQLVAAIKPRNLHHEIGWGAQKGKEVFRY